MIIENTIELMQRRHGPMLLTTRIEHVVVGVHFTGIKLSNGRGGMARTESMAGPNRTSDHQRDFGKFSPGHLAGHSVMDFLEEAKDSAHFIPIRLAALNAVSAGIIDESHYQVTEDMDPIDLLDFSNHPSVCLVGAFETYLRRIAPLAREFNVLELDPDAMPAEYRSYYRPPTEAHRVLPGAQIVIITGSTLSNNTLSELLSQVPPRARTVLVGPTSSLIPDVFFEHGIDIVGAIRILDADRMLTIIAEGGSGYHLFKSCARKICLTHD